MPTGQACHEGVEWLSREHKDKQGLVTVQQDNPHQLTMAKQESAE